MDRRYTIPRFHFTPHLRFGEPSIIRDDDGEPLFHYDGFAGITGVIAALVVSVVLLAGAGAAVFLSVQHSWVAAVIAIALSVCFSVGIALLVPRIHVTVYEDSERTRRAFTVLQSTPFAFPILELAVRSHEGRDVGHLRMHALSRLVAHRWSILALDGVTETGVAREESLLRATIRKVLGKFNPRYESDFLITMHSGSSGRIVRRPGLTAAGVLDLTLETDHSLDRRVAVALALLVFGAEP